MVGSALTQALLDSTFFDKLNPLINSDFIEIYYGCCRFYNTKYVNTSLYPDSRLIFLDSNNDRVGIQLENDMVSRLPNYSHDNGESSNWSNHIPFVKIVDELFESIAEDFTDRLNNILEQSDNAQQKFLADNNRILDLYESVKKNKVKAVDKNEQTYFKRVERFLNELIKILNNKSLALPDDVQKKILKLQNRQEDFIRSSEQSQVGLETSSPEQNNRSGGNLVPFQWKPVVPSKLDEEIQTVFNALIEENAIPDDTTFENFSQIFKGGQVGDNFKPIKWLITSDRGEKITSTPSLIYFFEQLKEKGKISNGDLNKIVVKRIISFFITRHGEKITSPKDKLSNYKKSRENRTLKNPQQYDEKISEILSVLPK